MMRVIQKTCAYLFLWMAASVTQAFTPATPITTNQRRQTMQTLHAANERTYIMVSFYFHLIYSFIYDFRKGNGREIKKQQSRKITISHKPSAYIRYIYISIQLTRYEMFTQIV